MFFNNNSSLLKPSLERQKAESAGCFHKNRFLYTFSFIKNFYKLFANQTTFPLKIRISKFEKEEEFKDSF